MMGFAYIRVYSPKSYERDIDFEGTLIVKALKDVTGRLLHCTDEEIIVEFETWKNPEPKINGAEFVLIRAEVPHSDHAKSVLDEWSSELRDIWQEHKPSRIQCRVLVNAVVITCSWSIG